jgi:hypothetical protein
MREVELRAVRPDARRLVVAELERREVGKLFLEVCAQARLTGPLARQQLGVHAADAWILLEQLELVLESRTSRACARLDVQSRGNWCQNQRLPSTLRPRAALDDLMLRRPRARPGREHSARVQVARIHIEPREACRLVELPLPIRLSRYGAVTWAASLR